MSALAVTFALAVQAGSAAAAAEPPVLRPATAEAVLEEVRRPGASAVLVNVWATWCQPCKEEMPDILRLGRELGGRGLRLVLVSGDFEDDAAEARAFLTRVGVDFPTFIKTGSDQAFIDGIDPRWSGALPATFVFDGSGVVREYWEGKTDYATLETEIRRVLHERRPAKEVTR